MLHGLKINHDALCAIRRGEKKAEVRINDRGYKTGDYLSLCEWDEQAKLFTGNECLVIVTHITEGGRFGLPNNLCVMSIQAPFIVGSNRL